ncbi:hypothetical protein LCGC14_0533620 [marine sediment metagenome]|uniref:Deoxynucleotide monophosphate kinase n=1 Tax=marine sediment metagenome TaxID=412755 RepID=A0A0F9SDE7_9ZZZZ
MGILIGVSGSAGVGKDTVANHFVDKFGLLKISFADPLKRICRDVFDFSDKALWGPSEERSKPDSRYKRLGDDDLAREIDKEIFPNIDYGPKFLTPRYALQKIGTEFGRNCYPNIWVEYALRLARTALANPAQYDYNYKYGLVPADRKKNPIQGVVFADCRFKNELDLIKENGGILIRIKRHEAGLSGEAGMHPSEKEQRGIPDSAFDYIIENYGTLKDLESSVLDLYDRF